MKPRKIVLLVLLVCWIIIIFLFSNQTAKRSESLSDNVSRNLIKIQEVITQKKHTEKQIKKIIKKQRFIIRKTAHFTLYFILGILSYSLFKENKKGFIISIILCLLYALSDEAHQLFINERAGRILDVCIDTIGSLIGILSIRKINAIRGNKEYARD